MGILQSHTKVLQNVILQAIILVFGDPVHIDGIPEMSLKILSGGTGRVN
jgi:hypothetical protein